MPFMGVTMRFKSLSGCAIAVLGLLLLGVTSSAAQNRETDRVRVFVQVSEERPEDAVVDANLPPGQWQLEPMSFGTEGNTYFFDLKQAQYLGQQLSKQLQRTNSRKELIELVETREEAAVYLEIVATKVEGNIQVVIGERKVLLRVENLQERGAGVAAKIAAELVDLVEHEHGVVRACLLDALDDAARQRAYVGPAVPADFGLVVNATQ